MIVRDFYDNNICQIAGHTILSQKYPSMPSYLVLPVNIPTISGNPTLEMYVILAVIVRSSDALPLYYATWDNRRKDARVTFYVIVRKTLRTVVRNNYKG